MKCPALKITLIMGGFLTSIAALVMAYAIYSTVPVESKVMPPGGRASRSAIYRGLLDTMAPQLPPQQSPSELFAPYFGNHMVFQRNQPLRLWGKAISGTIVRVSALGQKFSVYGSCTASADGSWFLDLPLKNAQGTFNIQVRAAEGETEIKNELKDVIFGDVFLCAGQSNMMMNLRNTKDCSVRMFKPGVPVRIVNMGEGKPCTHEWSAVEGGVSNLAEYSALATVFGDSLADKSQVPVGIVQVCAGGTSILHWLDPSQIPGDISHNIDKSAILPIYRYCVAPLQNCFFKAIIWYQGESDLEQTDTYRSLLFTLISSYRRLFGAELPVFVVQLPSIGKEKPYYYDSMVARLREAQASVQSLENCFCLTSFDTVNNLEDTLDPTDSKSISIHPLKKKALSERLADAIYAQCYQRGYVEIPRYAAPALPLAGCVKVNFVQTGGGLKAFSNAYLAGFTVAGADRKFHLARARITGDSIIVSSQDVPKPVAVRYLWADKTVGNLFAKNQLPVQPFRTDSWPLTTPYASILEIVAPGKTN